MRFSWVQPKGPVPSAGIELECTAEQTGYYGLFHWHTRTDDGAVQLPLTQANGQLRDPPHDGGNRLAQLPTDGNTEGWASELGELVE